MTEKKQERRGLGRGLSALMADVDLTNSENNDKVMRAENKIAVEKLVANPDQPRRQFSEEALADLTRSVGEKGVIQPLIVRVNPRDANTYEIVAGERRWRAAQRAQLHEVPVLIRDLNDTEVLELAIIENIQRADLNAVEEAMGFRQLMDRFGHTQEKLAEALGKSRSHIANLLRLLQLPEEILDHLREGRLSAGHARALITTDDPIALAKQVISKGLSVRQTEQLAKAPKAKSARPKPPRADADTRALEDQLATSLGLKVQIDHREGSEAGKLVLNYQSLSQLDSLCSALSSISLDESR
ncbi:ParB/RepB/Spo0J family partition protein [Brevirhabdus sp.]|uniref:ParB/RepB/Spo0J family partition protein n=1 Tax=Brevirhabdus sp. TaxID=2004514 RepID=UPI0040593802